jgi:tRNA threonylcarbamoyladenosine biosynthesis protein TsaB
MRHGNGNLNGTILVYTGCDRIVCERCRGSFWRCILKILALETSSEYCSAALWLDAKLDACEKHAGQLHSELLLGMIEDLLVRHEVGLADLDGIAFGEGPGTFTGLRIACGVTQGLALGAGVTVAGVGTLLAMAEASQKDRVVCCIDARMKEIYHAAFARRDGEWYEVCLPGVYAPQSAPALPGDGWHGCGNGFLVYKEALQACYEGQLATIDCDAHPHAREIARLAARVFQNGGGRDAAFAAPFYIRDKVALKTIER